MPNGLICDGDHTCYYLMLANDFEINSNFFVGQEM